MRDEMELIIAAALLRAHSIFLGKYQKYLGQKCLLNLKCRKNMFFGKKMTAEAFATKAIFRGMKNSTLD